MTQSTLCRVVQIAVLIPLTLSACKTVRWPYNPGNQTHNLGNNYGEYQNYGGGPYYHDGIDILAPRPRPMYAVEDGTVTHITDPGSGNYCGIMIGEPTAGGKGYLYWHVESSTIAVSVGDTVSAGDYIGDIVFWPVASFHHVHFSKVRGTGGYPWGWYDPIGNPISYLTPNTDTVSPVIKNAGSGSAFLFCENETSTYLTPQNLKGKVDIISLITDRFSSGATWDMAPYIVRVRITPQEQRTPVFKKTLVLFDGALGSSSTVVGTLYKDDATADSRGDYNNRDFFYVVTNTDNDLAIESTDTTESWDTTGVPNGSYQVTVFGQDRSGNIASKTMTVTVNN